MARRSYVAPGSSEMAQTWSVNPAFKLMWHSQKALLPADGNRIPSGVLGEDVPMTMQVAFRGKGGIVFASDTKVRTPEEEYSTNDTRTAAVVNQPKIIISKRHDIAVAMAGNGTEGIDATQELADHLADQGQITDENLSPLLIKWGAGTSKGCIPERSMNSLSVAF